MKRLLLAAGALVVALLVAEGALSLLSGRTLAELVGRPRVVPPPPRPPPPVRPDGSATPGLYRVHPDPRVGYVFKADADLAIFDGEFRTDELGLRARARPPRGPDALHLVVLGDSVAFGHGLDDEETLAHRLELLLDDAAAAAAGARPVEGRTVAVPGWNHRNAVACLLDHLDAIDPDVVVYLPIANDTRDTDGIDEVGFRRETFDAASHDPWLSVNQVTGVAYALRASEVVAAAGKPPWLWMGPDAVMSDISRESGLRYDENVASIRRLAEALERRGARLLVLQWIDVEYAWHLRRHMQEQGLDVPVLPLFTSVPAALTLGYDAHPSAEAIAGAARWIAAELLARGWLPGDPASIPPASETVEAARAPSHPLAEVLAASNEWRWDAWARLQPQIDFTTFRGTSQVYGGVNRDGTASARMLVMLPRAGSTLTVRLAGLPARPDLYPMDVAVEIDDVPAGALRLTGEEPVEARFDVPTRPAPAPPLEVRLVPERYGLVRDGEQGWQIASFRPLRLSCGAPDGGSPPRAERPPPGTPWASR